MIWLSLNIEAQLSDLLIHRWPHELIVAKHSYELGLLFHPSDPVHPVLAPLSLIKLSVLPLVISLPLPLIIHELANVHISKRPNILPLSFLLSLIESSGVLRPFLEY